jgi:putative endopeptidase
MLRDWWTEKDREAFEERTRVLIDQYDALEPAQAPGHHVNGKLTIGENIGDLGGLSIAFKAYQIAHEGNPEPELDGYAPAQRLFLSWAAVWQAKVRTEMLLQRMATDPHSPAEFRCNQIVRNLPEFYAAFDVAESDALWLDESRRVKIW